jgi:hypothetical protein
MNRAWQQKLHSSTKAGYTTSFFFSPNVYKIPAKVFSKMVHLMREATRHKERPALRPFDKLRVTPALLRHNPLNSK